MTSRHVRGSTALLALVVLSACGDDANDGAFQARRAADLAAELRAARAIRDTVASEVPVAEVAGEEPPTSTVAAVEPTGVVVPVFALDNSFRPAVVEIEVGDEVLWENRGLNEHNVLRVEGDGWGVEVEGFQPGAVYAHLFAEPGEYRYYCSIHGSQDVGMVGTVIVTG